MTSSGGFVKVPTGEDEEGQLLMGRDLLPPYLPAARGQPQVLHEVQ